jgi:hypothetical protein
MPYSDPKFPVVKKSPSVDDCIKSMRIRDMAVALGITSASWSYGYIFGKPARMPTASTAAALGLTFAGFVILQDTRGRLMGYNENSREVRLYGAVKQDFQPTKIETDRRFPTSLGGLMTEANRSKPQFKNYD